MKEKIARFMYGRYGVDQLSRFLMWIAVVFAILSMFLRFWVLDVITITLLALIYIRMLSKDHGKRRQENETFMILQDRVRNAWQNRRYLVVTCPGCGQRVRVPKGKGTLEISCPKCKVKFTKRS